MISMSKLRYFLLILLIIPTQIFSQSNFKIDFESGLTWNGYNNIEVPNGSGTRFSLTEIADPNQTSFYRIQLLYTLNERHTFRLLYAPLKNSSEGVFNRDTNFAGTTFSDETNFNGTYEFNSYRLTYRYLFSPDGKLVWGLGATAKIRDARIQISDDDQSAKKTDLGFVPLINFKFDWHFSEYFSLLFAGDALVSPGGQGRAEDVLLALRYYLEPELAFKLGYRILEGGADVDEVYNFTLFHYALIGITVGF